MNDHIADDTFVDFINMCETAHNDSLADLGEQISKDIENIRLIAAHLWWFSYNLNRNEARK